MSLLKTISKREFIKHTSQYIKLMEDNDVDLVITHENQSSFLLKKIKIKSFKDLRGLVEIKSHGDINESVFQGFENW